MEHDRGSEASAPECPLCGATMKWEPYVTEETVLDGYRCSCYEGGWRFG